MAEQKQTRKQSQEREEVEVDEVAPANADKGQELKDELDDLLDEIDEVLEEQAADFVKNYVQKGGQ